MKFASNWSLFLYAYPNKGGRKLFLSWAVFVCRYHGNSENVAPHWFCTSFETKKDAIESQLTSWCRHTQHRCQRDQLLPLRECDWCELLVKVNSSILETRAHNVMVVLERLTNDVRRRRCFVASNEVTEKAHHDHTAVGSLFPEFRWKKKRCNASYCDR